MPNDPRRQLTVPIQPTYRSTSPSPQSAPPVSSNNHRRSRSSIDDNTTSSTFQPKFIPPTRKKSLPIASRSTHPLQLEIDRLTAICEEHERAIRSSLSTIKHHVMTNMPDVFEKVNNIDIDAEAITANIQKTLSTYIPPFQSNLNRIKSDRSHDVEIMKQRTTPWKDIVLEFKSSLIDASSSSTSTKSTKHLDKAGKLIGIPGINDNEDESESAALTRISMWVEELDMYLSSEIVRVKERINSKTSKRQRLIRLITCKL
ncbi:uncharacterized protein L201_003961 [Kwoniella dendrophila CBS 6074]|uniref:Uncharacterized protein n=1 Tax=Kwoniella dendrophila CBS 6074 TaxID=1295534 RepID=A0AAX4JVX8_9TREE